MKTTVKLVALVVFVTTLGACGHTPGHVDGAGPRNHFLEARRIAQPASDCSGDLETCVVDQ